MNNAELIRLWDEYYVINVTLENESAWGITLTWSLFLTDDQDNDYDRQLAFGNVTGASFGNQAVVTGTSHTGDIVFSMPPSVDELFFTYYDFMQDVTQSIYDEAFEEHPELPADTFDDVFKYTAAITWKLES